MILTGTVSDPLHARERAATAAAVYTFRVHRRARMLRLVATYASTPKPNAA